MYPFGLIGWAGLLTVLVITSNVLADDTPVAFDTRKQWKWVDQSCDSRIDRLNIAAEEFLEMGDAAYTSLTKGGSTDASRQTLQALFKASSFQAILIRSKFNTLKGLGADGSIIPYSLYCDGSAFEWVTTYQTGDKKGDTIPNGGMWYAKRSNPDNPPLYIRGSKRNDYCSTIEGTPINAASAPGGNYVILCPQAFTLRESLGCEKGQEQPKGTSLASMVSLGSVLMHEMTHPALTTQDHAYGFAKSMLLALSNPEQARSNAESYQYYALAVFLSRNKWSTGSAK